MGPHLGLGPTHGPKFEPRPNLWLRYLTCSPSYVPTRRSSFSWPLSPGPKFGSMSPGGQHVSASWRPGPKYDSNFWPKHQRPFLGFQNPFSGSLLSPLAGWFWEGMWHWQAWGSLQQPLRCGHAPSARCWAQIGPKFGSMGPCGPKYESNFGPRPPN